MIVNDVKYFFEWKYSEDFYDVAGVGKEFTTCHSSKPSPGDLVAVITRGSGDSWLVWIVRIGARKDPHPSRVTGRTVKVWGAEIESGDTPLRVFGSYGIIQGGLMKIESRPKFLNDVELAIAYNKGFLAGANVR